MTSTATLKDLLAGVRIYADLDGFRKDEFGRRRYLEMKPLHDELYQKAIDLRLASALVVMQRKKPLRGLRSTFTVVMERPRWHPANLYPSRNSLLICPVTAFQRSWLDLRRSAEQPAKVGPLWHDDPTLVFEHAPNVFMCRTACTGHEGQVLYFAYRKEREWLTALENPSLSLFGEGEAAYRSLVPSPGALAE